MSLSTRKAMVITAVATVFMVANIWIVANWLEERGVIGSAEHIKAEYLTGTAVTIIVVLLILLVKPGAERVGVLRRCPVCDHTLLGRGKYCGECGSRV
ncbi:hypothetical protein ACFL09_00740 [Planctomycetota bacterium]